MTDQTATLPPTGNTERTRPENRAFYPALDGLRALAFFLVFGQHYLLLPWGWTGVNVFFVLSGFLITGILFDTRDDPHRFRNFYVRRSLRIFPLYYGLFAVLLLLTPLIHWSWSVWWFAWPLYLGNLLRFLAPSAIDPHTVLGAAGSGHLSSVIFPRSELYLGHLWSLCVEEQFYLVWPLVVFLVRDRRRLMGICACVLVLGPAFRLLAQHLAAPWLLQAEFLYRFTLCQTDALLLGALLALLWRGSARDTMLTVARVVAVIFGCAAAIYVGLTAKGWPLVPYHGPDWALTGGLLFANILAAAVMVCALEPTSLVYRVLRVRPLRWIGRLSYGAYVFHDLLHGLYIHLLVNTGLPQFASDTYARRFGTALVAMIGTLLLAWLSFRFYESPFLNLKDRWTRTGQQTG